MVYTHTHTHVYMVIDRTVAALNQLNQRKMSHGSMYVMGIPTKDNPYLRWEAAVCRHINKKKQRKTCVVRYREELMYYH